MRNDNDYTGPHDHDGYPTGPTDEQKRAMEDRARELLAICPRGIEPWVLYDGIRRAARNLDGAAYSYLDAVAAHAARRAGGEMVWREDRKTLGTPEPIDLSPAQWAALLLLVAAPKGGQSLAALRTEGVATTTTRVLVNLGLAAWDASPETGVLRATLAGRRAWMDRMTWLVVEGHQAERERTWRSRWDAETKAAATTTGEGG